MMEADALAGQVGIFWGVPDGSTVYLLMQATLLAQAEAYGEFLTHPAGHAETWDAWRVLGPTSLTRRGLPAVIAFHEYEHFPRGRVVFHRPTGWFTIYADRRLFGLQARMMAAFTLPSARTRLQGDMHYQAKLMSFDGERNAISF